MTDLLIQLSEDGRPDIVVEGDDLVLDRGLETAVLASLFSDARLEGEDAPPDGSSDPRGYWADEAGDRYGSLLWVFERARLVPGTAAVVEDHVRAALRWMLDVELAEEILVDAELVAGRLEVGVAISQGRSRRWSHLWDAIRARTFAAEPFLVRLLPR